MPRLKALFTNYQAIILGFLLFSLCFDFVDKIGMFYHMDLIKLNRILKAIFLGYSLLFIFSHLKYLLSNLKLVLGFILVLSLIFLLKNNFSDLYVNEYVRYIFPLLVFPLIYYAWFNNEQNFLAILYKCFKGFILINSVLALIGLFFDVRVFQTYEFQRFGYNGIILSQGFTPYLYLSATTLFWVFNDKKMILVTLIISVLSGIKGVFFAEFLLLSLLTLFDSHFNKAFKIKSLIIASIIFIGVLIGIFMMPLFREVIESDGLIAAIFSYRTDNTMELYNQITPSNYNYLIGAIELEKVRLELQIFDIILFFGIIGFIAFSVFLYWLYTHLVNNAISKAFFITTLVLSVLSGNLFYIPLSAILLFLILLALHKSKDSKHPAF